MAMRIEDYALLLACSFWLVHVWQMQGREAEAHELFGRLLALRNDVGLLSEKYDARTHRLPGNFPQTFSRVALVNAGLPLSGGGRASRFPRPDSDSGPANPVPTR